MSSHLSTWINGTPLTIMSKTQFHLGPGGWAQTNGIVAHQQMICLSNHDTYSHGSIQTAMQADLNLWVLSTSVATDDALGGNHGMMRTSLSWY